MHNVSTFLNPIRAFIVRERPPFLKDAEGLHGKSFFPGAQGPSPPLPIPHSKEKDGSEGKWRAGVFRQQRQGQAHCPTGVTTS